MNYSGGIILPTVKNFSLHKSKSSELWLVHNPELRVEVYLNKIGGVHITYL